MIYTPGNIKSITLWAAAILIMMLPLTFAACGDSGDTASSAETIAANITGNPAQDRAALLAAESQLRNAQMAQEQYFAENGRYAATASDLGNSDLPANSRVEVVSGNASGYEIQITASDSTGTVLILRKTGTRLERVDGNGDPW